MPVTIYIPGQECAISEMTNLGDTLFFWLEHIGGGALKIDADGSIPHLAISTVIDPQRTETQPQGRMIGNPPVGGQSGATSATIDYAREYHVDIGFVRMSATSDNMIRIKGGAARDPADPPRFAIYWAHKQAITDEETRITEYADPFGHLLSRHYTLNTSYRRPLFAYEVMSPVAQSITFELAGLSLIQPVAAGFWYPLGPWISVQTSVTSLVYYKVFQP